MEDMKPGVSHVSLGENLCETSGKPKPDSSDSQTTTFMNLEEKTGSLRNSQKKTTGSLEEIRARLNGIRRELTREHQIRKEVLSGRIAWLEREVGSREHLLSCNFSDEEIAELKMYVNNNPYLRSVLSNRNSRLLQTLLDYSVSPKSSAGLEFETDKDGPF